MSFDVITKSRNRVTLDKSTKKGQHNGSSRWPVWWQPGGRHWACDPGRRRSDVVRRHWRGAEPMPGVCLSHDFVLLDGTVGGCDVMAAQLLIFCFCCGLIDL